MCLLMEKPNIEFSNFQSEIHCGRIAAFTQRGSNGLYYFLGLAAAVCSKGDTFFNCHL